ncbi:MAG: helix-turn-helix domain-containing protein [Oscillospiraceae bacterium]
MSENNKTKDELQDILKVEGINCKGFGVIPKAVMHDLELSIVAKAIYAYFCSLAGNGTTAFPNRDTIIYHLQISKDFYYKNFKQIEEQGFIKVERTCIFPYKNIYTLVTNPKKFEEKETQYNKPYSQIKYSGLKAFGFGTIPRVLMVDDRLSVQAKGIYAYFCSYAGSGIAAFPKKEKILYHLQLSEKTYYKYYNQLVLCNYITVVQRKSEKGQFDISDYYLNETPDIAIGEKVQAEKEANKAKKNYPQAEIPNSNLQDSEEKGLNTGFSPNGNLQDNAPNGNLPDSTLPDSTLPDSTLPDSIGQDTIINSTTNNSFIKIKGYKNQSINQQPSEGTSEEALEDLQYSIYEEMLSNRGIPYQYKADKEKMTIAIHILTDWDTFYPRGYFDEIKQDIYLLLNECLIEMTCADEMANYKGSIVSYAKVIDKINQSIDFGKNGEYMTLNNFVEEAIDDFQTASKKYEIKAYVPYMKSCLWNCFLTYKVKFHATVDKLVHGYYD